MCRETCVYSATVRDVLILGAQLKSRDCSLKFRTTWNTTVGWTLKWRFVWLKEKKLIVTGNHAFKEPWKSNKFCKVISEVSSFAGNHVYKRYITKCAIFYLSEKRTDRFVNNKEKRTYFCGCKSQISFVGGRKAEHGDRMAEIWRGREKRGDNFPGLINGSLCFRKLRRLFRGA